MAKLRPLRLGLGCESASLSAALLRTHQTAKRSPPARREPLAPLDSLRPDNLMKNRGILTANGTWGDTRRAQ
jgi:hypothetical protein